MPDPRALAVVLAVSTSLCSSGCAAQFRRTSARLGDTVGAAAAGFEPQLRVASGLCRERARLDFLRHRLQGGRGFEWDDVPRWGDWYRFDPRTRDPAGGKSWDERCAAVAGLEDVQRSSLAVLAAYGRGLRGLVDQGSYQQRDLTEIAESSGALARKLAQDSALAAHRDILAGAGEPLTSLSDLLLKQWTDRKLAEVIWTAAPAFDKLMGLLAAYSKAVEEEQIDVSRRFQAVLAAAEAKMRSGSRDAAPMDAILFYEVARRNEDALARAGEQQARYRKALSALKEAHRRLAEVAAGGERDERGLMKVNDELDDASAALAPSQESPRS